MMKTNKSVENRKVMSMSVASIYQLQNQQSRVTDTKGNSFLSNTNKDWTLTKKCLKNNYIFENQLQRETNLSKRMKTEGDTKNEQLICSDIFTNFKQCKESKLYHPSIYHQAAVRKKYFCGVIDSYIRNRTTNISENTYVAKKCSMGVKLQNNKVKTIIGSKRPGSALHTEHIAPSIADVTKIANSHVIGNPQYAKEASHSKRIFGQKGWTKKVNTKNKYINKLASESKVTNFNGNYIKQGNNKNESQQNSFSDENNEFQAYFQNIQSNPKLSKTNKLLETMSIYKNVKNSTQYSSFEDVQVVNQLLQQLQERLNLISTNININIQQQNVKIIDIQPMYRLLMLKVSPQAAFPKHFKSKLIIKQFKQDYKSKYMANIIQKVSQFNVSNLWTMLPKSKNAKLNRNQLFYSSCSKSLREQFFTFKVNEKSDKNTISYIIHTTQSYNKLFQNNCQYFCDIIVALAEDLLKMRGNIINNNFTLDNVFRLQQKCIKIGDWGCSAICRRLLVAGKEVTFKDEPTLKIQDTMMDNNSKQWQWLTQPECLPPEILKCLLEGRYDSIWNLQESPQIWSLGIMIFQLLTAVPVWFPYPAAIGHKVPRLGYFYDSVKRLKCIHEQQMKIGNIVGRWFRDQKNSIFYDKIHPQILNLMRQMLQTNSKLRPTPEQIVRRMKNI